MPTQNHIHITPYSQGASDEGYQYRVRQGSLDQTPFIPVVMERSITAKLHVHRLLDGDGDPVQFVGDAMLLMVTNDELNALLSVLATDVWYVPIIHPDDGEDHTTYAKQCVFTAKPGSVSNVDPMCTWWTIAVEFTDNTL